MGVSTDLLAQARGISRQAQDAFALTSHQKAAAAQAAGEFRAEIAPVMTYGRNNAPILVEQDQCIRPDTSLERLAELQPAFLPVGGTVTAGNASPLSDGAAAMLVMSLEKAHALGLKPLVRIVATAMAGVPPIEFGLGPVPATRKVLARAKMTLADLDLIEINEAFAAQVLACLQELDVDLQKLNVRGGALAIGHPLGASGARIATTLIHNMVARGATTGLATMCVGHGQGMAVVFERVD
jgi:acetyl-CoA acetyltransferase family protein